MTKPATLVHVIDDDAAVRNALRWLFEGESLIVQTYASAEEFLATFSNELPGCAVVDLRMPGMSGLELQETLARRRVQLPLVFVTAHGDVSLAVMAMRRGAVDFVEKPFADERLVDAVRRALGTHERHPDGEEEPGIVRARAAGLSARERDVLVAVVEGKSSKVIAAELGIATKTVEAHRARIMSKLGARSLAGLVRLVVRHGLLELPRS
ncbi:MAG: DNA-binding response regulator [Betaproteobacteria bacterium]|nr:MAG: DNA-binding response regulator [Betaproteobacteria bacterium]